MLVRKTAGATRLALRMPLDTPIDAGLLLVKSERPISATFYGGISF
jgi:hypothetical protein